MRGAKHWEPNMRLRRERELRGWSQRALAEMVGTSEQVLNRWEAGQHKPNRYFQTQLCKLLGKNAEELGFMGGGTGAEEVSRNIAGLEKQALASSSQQSSLQLLEEGEHTHAQMPSASSERMSLLSQHSLFPTASPPIQHIFLQPEAQHETMTPLAISPLFKTDVGILAHVSTILTKSTVVSEKEMGYFDQQTRLYWRAREETSLPATVLYDYVVSHIDDINQLFARSHLPTLRSYLCEILCRTVLLAGMLLYDLGHYANARSYYQVAFQAASEANNALLQAIVWGWMSFTWTYAKHYTEALRCVQHARSFARQTIDVLTQSWLSAIESEIQAHLCNRAACLQALDDMERGMEVPSSQDTSYLFEFNAVLLLGYKGVCLQQLYRQQEPQTRHFLHEAKASLELALVSDAPAKRKLYYVNDLAGVYARQGEIEAACTHVIQSIPLIARLGSGSKTIRSHLYQVRALLQPYEHLSPIQALDDCISSFFIDK